MSRENKGKGKSYAEVYADSQPCENRVRELTRIPGAIRCLSEVPVRDLHRLVGDSRLRPRQSKGTLLCGKYFVAPSDSSVEDCRETT